MFVYYSMITKENIMNEQMELDLGNISPSIDLLPLTPRQNRAMKAMGVQTIACLVENSVDGVARFLLKNKYFGRKTVMNVMGKLDELEIAYKF